ncbi:MAG: NAD(P)H-hydrate dehydratase [Marinobacterium sp.]
MNESPIGSSLFTAAQCKVIDRLAIESMPIPGYQLMCRAARSAQHWITRLYPKASSFNLVCGAGNNGGDGLALAKLLFKSGHVVTITLASTDFEVQLSGEALEAWNDLPDDLPKRPFDPAVNDESDLIVDALLGIGLNGEVRSDSAAVIHWINRQQRPVFSLDIPSGLSADTGSVLGSAVKADATLTFIAPKQGMFINQARDYVGRVMVDSLGVPAELFPESQSQLISEPLSQMAPLNRAAHKGSQGSLVVIGGDFGFGGAPMLSSEAALRTGAGRVTLLTNSESAVTAMLSRTPEVMVRLASDIAAFESMIQSMDAIAIGPGLGQSDWALSCLERVNSLDKPTVVDADALNLIAQNKVGFHPHAVFTPHPGEAARLLGCSIAEVQSDPVGSAFALQSQLGGVIVLKGAGSIVCNGHKAFICNLGNPGMATAGMGDLLSGIIATFLAQGYSLLDSAQIGVWLHAKAGDMASAEGERGLIATDLLPHIRSLLG